MQMVHGENFRSILADLGYRDEAVESKEKAILIELNHCLWN